MPEQFELYQNPVKFRQIVLSALMVLGFGCGAFFLYPHWTWFGELGGEVVLYGCGLGVFSYYLAYVLTCSKRVMTPSMRLVLQNLRLMFQNFTWPQIILVSILAGLGEELLLRGLVQVWLQTQLGPLAAILIASLIFGFMHYMNLTYVAVTFVGGLILGSAFYFSQSLLLVVIAHAIYDVCAFAMIVKFPHILGLDSIDD